MVSALKPCKMQRFPYISVLRFRIDLKPLIIQARAQQFAHLRASPGDDFLQVFVYRSCNLRKIKVVQFLHVHDYVQGKYGITLRSNRRVKKPLLIQYSLEDVYYILLTSEKSSDCIKDEGKVLLLCVDYLHRMCPCHGW